MANTTTKDRGQRSELDLLIAEAARYPLLAQDEENELANLWRDKSDQHALNKLLGSHLRLVIKLARGLRGYGVPLEDLIAEGNVGLMQAAQRYDPERQVRFATYAAWWIRASMHELVLKSGSIVRTVRTGDQKKLFFNLRRMKARRAQRGETGDLTEEAVAEIATQLGVSEADVREMDQRLGTGDVSLDAPLTSEGEDSRIDFLSDDQAPTPETVIAEEDERDKRRRLLNSAMSGLNDRERHILQERRLSEEPRTLEELSQVYGVSRERIRQIEARALEKLAVATRRAASDRGLIGRNHPPALAA
ncbi:RNA polymerase factor sigma-32 [Algihabitans sp.]|uniref:RNA polymerase factor sigma-32 n=1 Tax=Algihabitans sp. TaxID=2821514 RepID=UPI003BAA1F0A